jgi:hypothetical protein
VVLAVATVKTLAALDPRVAEVAEDLHERLQGALSGL